MRRFRQAAFVALVAYGTWLALREPAPACGLLPGATGELVLWSRRVVTSQGTLAAAVHIRDGRFASIRLEPELPPGALDYGDLVISPVRFTAEPRAGSARADTRAAAASLLSWLFVQRIWLLPNFHRPQGLVDLHVHMNEPGREEWEGFVTGTQSAAAGGITTVVDQPLNCFPTVTSKEIFDAKLEASKACTHTRSPPSLSHNTTTTRGYLSP